MSSPWSDLRTAALAVAAAGWSLAAPAASFTGCAEPADGPPWLFHDPKQGGRAAGFTADFWPVLFGTMGHELRLRTDLPFKRCLRAVAAGEVDFVLGAYRDPEREQVLVFGAPYRMLTPQVFYRQAQPLDVRSKADLKRWRGCGMNGSSYAHYGLGPGELDQGARSYRVLIEKLMVGRCDYFVEELEVIQQLNLGRSQLISKPGMAHAPVPDVTPPAMQLAAGRGTAAAALLPALDQAWARALKAGDVARVWQRYAPALPF